MKHFDFSTDWQEMFLASFIRCPELFEGVENLFDYGYFSGTTSMAVAKLIQEHLEATGRIPDFTILGNLANRKHATSDPEALVYIQRLSEHDTNNSETYRNQFVEWVKRETLRIALLKVCKDFDEGQPISPSWEFTLAKAFATGVSENQTEGKSLTELVTTPIQVENRLLGNRWLDRGGSVVMAAPTGMGKSSAMVQAKFCWAAGVPCFGIKPAKDLKILTVQAENDEGDQIEMARGVLLGTELTDEQLDLVAKNTIMVQHSEHTGEEFLGFLAVLLRKHQPDLVIIDPLNAFLGADVSKAETIATFCRHGLNPLLRRFNCAAWIIHHQNKPPTEGRDTKGMNHIDWRYRYAGNADLANWCRAMLTIEPTASPAIFKFIAAKRGSRIGWTDNRGNPVAEKYFMHSPDKIFWVEPGALELAELQEMEDSKRREKRGGVQELYPDDRLLEPLSEGPLTHSEWLARLKEDGCAISESRLSRRKRDLLDKKKVEERDRKFYLVKRPGRKEPHV